MLINIYVNHGLYIMRINMTFRGPKYTNNPRVFTLLIYFSEVTGLNPAKADHSLLNFFLFRVDFLWIILVLNSIKSTIISDKQK